MPNLTTEEIIAKKRYNELAEILLGLTDECVSARARGLYAEALEMSTEALSVLNTQIDYERNNLNYLAALIKIGYEMGKSPKLLRMIKKDASRNYRTIRNFEESLTGLRLWQREVIAEQSSRN